MGAPHAADVYKFTVCSGESEGEEEDSSSSRTVGRSVGRPVCPLCRHLLFASLPFSPTLTHSSLQYDSQKHAHTQCTHVAVRCGSEQRISSCRVISVARSIIIIIIIIVIVIMIGNDPSAGSPTETLLRLLLPLNDRTRTTSRTSISALAS